MKRLRSAIRVSYQAVGWLHRVVFVLVVLLIAGMAVSVGYEVFMRYVMNRPTIWATEVSGYLLVATAFLAAAYVARHDGHPKVDALVIRLSAKAQLRLQGVGTFVSLIFFTVLCWQGWLLAWKAYSLDWHSSSILRAPLFYPMVTISIGAGLLSLELLVSFIYRCVVTENE